METSAKLHIFVLRLLPTELLNFEQAVEILPRPKKNTKFGDAFPFYFEEIGNKYENKLHHGAYLRTETSDVLVNINEGDMKVVELAVWFIRCPLHLVGYLAHLQFISKIHPTGYNTNLFSGKTNLRMSAEDGKVFTYCHSRLFVRGNSGDKNDPTGLPDMELQHFLDSSKHRQMQAQGKLLFFCSISRTMGAAVDAFEAAS